MKDRSLNLVIKIGTLALSGEDGAPDAGLLEKIAGEIAALKQLRHHVILVTSGAVGAGRALMKGYQCHPRASGDPASAASAAEKSLSARGRAPLDSRFRGNDKGLLHCDEVAERQIFASLGQARLMTLYQDLFAPFGINAAQILLTKQDFRTRAHHKQVMHLLKALEKQPHIVPIVNENDSVTVDELMFTDNDELAGLLAGMMNADRLIILSHVAGVYDRAPGAPGAKVIPLIDWHAKKGLPDTTKGKSAGGRGGMQSKLDVARKMANLGIRTHIAAAREDKVIGRLLADEPVGTAIAPLPGKRNAVKRWLASEINLAPASVTANACLAGIIRDPHQAISLLPVGLTRIKGAFGKGDLVQVVDEKGKILALGVARYDAAALRRALGKKQQPVFIHYDQLHRVAGE